jgi:acyl carrier protein
MGNLRESNSKDGLTSSVEFQRVNGNSEGIVAQLWCEVFSLQNVGRTANFFELGGDSLRAVTLTRLLNERFGIQLHVVALFQSPTVHEIASLIDRLRLDSIGPSADPDTEITI